MSGDTNEKNHDKMKKAKKSFIMALFLSLLSTTGLRAQFVVHDPGSLAQAITSYAQYIASANNTLNTFMESQKIFEQGKEYYDSLKGIHELIKNGRKVEESVRLSLRAIDEFNDTYASVSSDGYFTASQIGAYNRQQSAIMKGMADVIGDITRVITTTGMSMSDKDRMDSLDDSFGRVVSLFNKSRGINMQMLGESNAVKERKAQKRLERELLR